MIILNPEQDGAVVKGDVGFAQIKIFDQDSIPAHGWKLIAIIYSDEVEKHSGQAMVYDPPYQQNGSNYGGNWHTQQVHDIPVRSRKPTFLMGRAKDDVLEEFEKGKAEARRREEQLKKDLVELRKHHDKSSTELINAKARMETLLEGAVNAGEQRRQLEKTNAKLETDLAKIRGEIGDAKWRSVINPEGKTLPAGAASTATPS